MRVIQFHVAFEKPGLTNEPDAVTHNSAVVIAIWAPIILVCYEKF